MMEHCPNCGREVADYEHICPSCGVALDGDNKEGFIGFLFGGLLALFLPLISLILIFVIRKEKRHTARFMLVIAIVSIVFRLLLMLLMWSVFIQLLIGIFGSAGYL